MKKQFALLVLGLVLVLLLSAQLARAAAFPNDRDPYWSYDARRVAFDREEITGTTVVHDRPAATTSSRAVPAGTRSARGPETTVDRLDVVRNCERVLRP